jgi:monoamine oxidase
LQLSHNVSLFQLLCVISNNGAMSQNIVIVGAGLSGMLAAAELMENGFTDIFILEAEDRIGGRVYSIPFGSGYIDLGAQWCHLPVLFFR